MWFNNIVGHSRIVSNLSEGLRRNSINHALLFDGMYGVGKRTVAEALSKGLLCIEKGECIDCPACIQFNSGTNPDYKYITPIKNTIRKEQIDEIINFLNIKPFNSKYKIVLVERFDLATVEAQNAMLKVLEEPPIYAKIILLSENKTNLLDTILSRVKSYNFYPIEKNILAAYLMKYHHISENDSVFLAEYSGGSIGIAQKIYSDNKFLQDRKKSLEILDSAIKAQRHTVVKNLGFFTEDNIEQIMDLYITWLRDLKHYKISGDINSLYNIDYQNMIISQSFLSLKTIDYILSLIISVKSDMEYNIALDFIVEMFFIDIMEECKWIK